MILGKVAWAVAGGFVFLGALWAALPFREYPGVDATRLSALVAFDRSTLGSVLGRLEAKEFIERRPSDADSRVKLLYLTALGKKTLAAAAPAVERAQERMLEPLGGTDQRRLMQLLAELVHLNNETSRAPQRDISAA